MTQIATVRAILHGGKAEIWVPRKSACGHDCEECAGCGTSGMSMLAKADNPIFAQPGEKVLVESSTKKLMHIVFLVYSLPLIAFFCGYLLIPTGWGETVRIAMAVIAFVLGLIPAVCYDRKLRSDGGMSFTIVKRV